jgi:sodium/hydrogen antiporter
MPTLAVDNFNIVCATLGSFIAIFGLVSFLFKEKFYLSETRKAHIVQGQRVH